MGSTLATDFGTIILVSCGINPSAIDLPVEMTIGGHLDELRLRLIRVVVAMLVLTAFCLSFGMTTVHLSFVPSTGMITLSEVPYEDDQVTKDSIDITIYYPYYNPFDNVAIQLTTFMKNTLLPPEVSLIQTAPGQAFFSQVFIAVLLSVLISMPLIIREMYAFISPAFGKSTKSVLAAKTFVPTILLFIIGVIFSYVLVIPFILNFLYAYGESIGVATFFSINEFFPFVLQLLLAFGLAFELPAIMYALSLTGVVDAAFWKKNFRYAVIIFVIFGAIITPDGGGISMWLVVAPMVILYLVGLLVIKKSRNENNSLANSEAEVHRAKY
ncbi:MAG: twin-arginine translocase subunit TatC [Nitrososphaeraceae archaeon]